jgi:beta-N-acetylhexosaminidase
MPRALIVDCAGARPTADEKAVYREADPWGFILFARHCQSADDVRAACAEFRSAVGRDAPVLIDQEGGRVVRMKPPVFPEHPAPAAFGRLFRLDPKKALEAARLNARLIGRMIAERGVTIDCAPMLDVPQIDSDKTVIGDRALATHPDQVAALGRAVLEGLFEGGAVPVVKHLPGHGRATVDSHHALPRVAATKEDLRAVDFAPFRALREAPIGMTAHVVYEAYDRERCATLSETVIRSVIRGEIGFSGLLLSDDLKMKALGGPVGGRVRDALAAGVDIACCCNFTLDEMAAAAEAAPRLAGEPLARAERALAARRPPLPGDPAADYERLARLIKPALVA